ncbi:MAG TPA: hypothetical protein VFN51_01970 [Candidatus Saccharimonadales bacterium]|nr:hypothetical protein [Candidatus Saccharimonadales bacterium]
MAETLAQPLETERLYPPPVPDLPPPVTEGGQPIDSNPLPPPPEIAPDPGPAPVPPKRRRSPGETNDSPEDPAGTEIRYRDAELLGKSFRIRRSVHEAGTKSIKTWQAAGARIKNALDSPGKALKNFAFKRARNSYQRKLKRQEAAKNQLIKDRRQGSVDKAKDKMDNRAVKVQEHIERMDKRTAAVHENADRRRQEYKDELKNRRQRALARKALREQLRKDGASRSEAKAILAEISSEHIDRVGKVAISTEASKLKLSQAARSKKRAERRHQKTDKKIDKTYDRIVNLERQAKGASEIATEIANVKIPQTRKRIGQLKKRLSSMEENSDARLAVQEDLKNAEAILSRHEANLQYWYNVGKNSRNKGEDKDKKLAELRLQRARHLGQIALADQRVTAKKAVSSSYQKRLEQTLQEVLNN